MTDGLGNITQKLTCATYTTIASPGSKYRDEPTYQLPLQITQNLTSYSLYDSYNEVTYDLQSGYALSQSDIRLHTLHTGGYFGPFFEIIAANEGVVPSMYNLTT